MIEYVVALAAIALLGYYVLKVPLRSRSFGIALAIFLLSSFIWGSVAEAFKIQPTDVLTGILYSATAFLLFWVLWLKFGRSAD